MGIETGRRRWLVGSVLSLALLAAACGEKKEESKEAGETSEQAEEALSPFELENGIGPIKAAVELGAIDQAMVATGSQLFDTKCAMCHKMDTTYVGPALGAVTTRRTPAYIMNMILNPQEMVERHPVAKQLLAERMTFMANQNLKIEEARAVLEYLRTQAKATPKP
jgi:mono/diheme cytochrome c family protein